MKNPGSLSLFLSKIKSKADEDKIDPVHPMRMHDRDFSLSAAYGILSVIII
jgi:hypothetical protein